MSMSRTERSGSERASRVDHEARVRKSIKAEQREAERQAALRAGSEPLALASDLEAARREWDRLARAVTYHRDEIQRAGEVRMLDVVSGERARRKHRADVALWSEADDA